MLRRTKAALEEELECALSSIAQLSAAHRALQDDLERRREAEEGTRREIAVRRKLMDEVPDFLFVKDRNGRFVLANAATAALTRGGTPGCLLGRNEIELHDSGLLPHKHLAASLQAAEEEVMRFGAPSINLEEHVRLASGARKVFSTTRVPLRDPDGEVIGLFAVSRDVTDHREARLHLRYLTEHDALTGLGNRAFFVERLAQMIAEAVEQGALLKIVSVDVDHFKLVNDSLGHMAADDILKTIALRLEGAIDAVAVLLSSPMHSPATKAA